MKLPTVAEVLEAVRGALREVYGYDDVISFLYTSAGAGDDGLVEVNVGFMRRDLGIPAYFSVVVRGGWLIPVDVVSGQYREPQEVHYAVARRLGLRVMSYEEFLRDVEEKLEVCSGEW